MDEIINVVEEATGTTVVGYSEVAREGDITWYLFTLADGRWAATDDAEAAPDRVNVYATRDEAIRDLWAAWLEAGGDRSDRVRWLLPEPADAR